MKKRFIVALNPSPVEGDIKFKTFLSSMGVGWWHWLADTWLVSDASGKLTAAVIRDKVQEIYPSIHCIVLEFGENEDTWAGFGPNSEKKNMFQWLRESWGDS